MRLRNKKIMGFLGLGALLSTASISAIPQSQTIDVHYGDVQIEVDGEAKATDAEPFNYNGTLYVGLRAMSELLGVEVLWDGETQTVKLETHTSDDEAVQQLQTLQEALDEANKKVAYYEALYLQEENNLIDLVALEEEVEDRYGERYDVQWDYDISGNQDRLRVTLAFDSEEENRDFSLLSQNTLGRFMQDICTFIQEEVEKQYEANNVDKVYLDHKVEVRGELYDTEREEIYAEFQQDEEENFYYRWLKPVTINISELKDYEWILEDNYDTFPRVMMTGYDYNSIRIEEIILDEQDGEIAYKIYTSLEERGRPYWDTVSMSNTAYLKAFMEAIRVELKAQFDVDAIGYLYDSFDELMAIYNGHITLY